MLLLSKKDIKKLVKQVARDINNDFQGNDKDPIVVTVMNGGLIFAGNLIPKLDFDCQLDYVHVSRYGNSQQPLEQGVRWLVEPFLNPKDRNVIIIDDILDEGISLEHIVRYYEIRGAKTISIATLLCKVGVDGEYKSYLIPTYYGSSIDDIFVYGYGMDSYGGYKRNLNGIYYDKKA